MIWRYEIQLQLGAKILFREAAVSSRSREEIVTDAGARAVQAMISEWSLGTNGIYAGSDMFDSGTGVASRQGATFIVSFTEAREI